MALPAIIDVEASGFGRGSYPIEVAVALDNREIHGFLIRPETHWTHWSEQAQALHGISRQELEQQGEPAKQVAQSLNDLLKGTVVYSDAWGFDNSWVGRLFHDVDVVPLFRIETINRLLDHTQMERWHTTKEEVWQRSGQSRHRASVDVHVLQETFRLISE